MKKIILLFVVLIVNLCFVTCANAENFYIRYYDVQIKVDKDKSAHVTENIYAYFTKASHGIYRSIQLGEHDKITNIMASEKYSIQNTRKNVTIRIGDPKKYVFMMNDRKYSVYYTYHTEDNKNEFYYNIIGTGWGVDINYVKFKVILPENIDPDKVSLYVGEYGTKTFKDKARYSVDGNVITGETVVNLDPYNGVTLKVEVYPGYFIPKEKNFFEKYTKELTVTLMAFFTFISFIIWFSFGKDTRITPIETFYPPENLNSAQVGVIYKEKATLKDVVSLIYYLAAKGYIKINNSAEEFELEKIKEYDGNNRIEKDLLDAIFGSKKKITESALRKSETFYKKMEKLVKELSEFKKEIFTPESLSINKKLPIIFCIVGTLLLMIFSLANFDFSILSSFLFIFTFVWLTIGITFSFLISLQLPPFTRILMLLGGISVTTFPLTMFFDDIFQPKSFTIAGIGIALTILQAVCFVNLPQWKKETRYLKGAVLGLKKSLQVAEKQNITHLLEGNPNYCYDLLSYAYVLDVTPHFMEIIDSLLLPAPDWHTGYFTNHAFHHFSHHFYNSSIPTSANGGVMSSGGGGCSGGGHGGGGGGSW